MIFGLLGAFAVWCVIVGLLTRVELRRARARKVAATIVAARQQMLRAFDEVLPTLQEAVARMSAAVGAYGQSLYEASAAMRRMGEVYEQARERTIPEQP